MSLPTVPDINPLITLTREEVYNLLLTSIAMEEIGLSHILNAEGEKIQKILQTEDACIEHYLRVNRSVDKVMRSIMKNQMLLLTKLEELLDMELHNQAIREDECYDE